VKRLRPKFMTVATTMIGLVPSCVGDGDRDRRDEADRGPVIGGILTSFILELVVYPPIYEIWKWNFEMKRQLPEGNGRRDVPGDLQVPSFCIMDRQKEPPAGIFIMAR